MLHAGAFEVTDAGPPGANGPARGGDALPHNVGPVFVGRIGRCYRPCPMAAKTAFTKKELDDLRERLVEEKEQLQVQLSTIEEATFATSQSDMSGEVSFDDENADAGTFTFERERDLSIENNVRDLLRKIDRALARMDEGTYGICSRCGKPIEKARLKALPYADLCIKDAQAQARSR
jgi:RNA polymerase-binding protein DksA